MLYVAGEFLKINSVAHKYAASLSIRNASVSTWNPKPSTSYDIYDMAFDSNAVYFGGAFQQIQVDKVYGSLFNWNPKLDNYVFSISKNDKTLYTAGRFQLVSGESRNGIAAFDLVTLKLKPFDPKLTNIYDQPAGFNSSAIYGNTLFVASSDRGNIKSNSDIRGSLAGINLSSRNLTKFNPDPNNLVRTLNITQNKLISGGDWETVDKTLSQSYFAVYNLPPLTSLDSASASAVTTLNATPVKSSSSYFTIEVFPNPTFDDATLNIRGASKTFDVSITDASGVIMWKRNKVYTGKTKLATHNLASGVYFIKVNNEKESVVLKLVKP